MDYVFRFLGTRFLQVVPQVADEQETEAAAAGLAAVAGGAGAPPGQSHYAMVNQADAPSCSDCGAIMVRNGACYKCANCGGTSGCS